VSRKICVVTGTRAEFGLLRLVMENVRATPGLDLQVVVTGAHLSKAHGHTHDEVREAGFTADAEIDLQLEDDGPVGISRSLANGILGFAEAFHRLGPDLLLVLGDRYEILAAATAALIAGIPIGHIHGGESTEGAIDEAIRHSVTKMSHLHFVAAEDYRRRVIQLGEDPHRVFNVGGLGVDAIRRSVLLDREALEASLDFKLGGRNLLVTFHPVTLEGNASAAQCEELLAALDQLHDTSLIFSMPNADTGNREISRQIRAFVSSHANARAYASLGQQRYFSCMKWVDGVVGNSSSGIAEAPSMGVGTVNIGDRQSGRLRAESVIDCPPEREAILAAIEQLYSPDFRRRLPGVKNPYGDGGASERIVQLLKEFPLEGILKKAFHDLAPAREARPDAW
jgi:GDP/UDP-N,N'-diacetylbacillosamine 2-epimerase (hydrolysing)